MKVFAQHSNARIAPRKVRPLGGMIVGMGAEQALVQLQWRNGKAAELVHAVLQSAIANAKHNHEIELDNLRVGEMTVNEGFRFKRFQPVSRGMGHPFVKQTCHIRVAVEEIEERAKDDKPKKTEIETLEIDDLPRDDEPAEDISQETKSSGKKKAQVSDGVAQDVKSEASGKARAQQRGGSKHNDK